MKRVRFFIFIVGAISLSGVAFFFNSKIFPSGSESKALNMALNRVDSMIDGSEIPLGISDVISERSEKILGVDDYLQKKYIVDGREFVVFIAFWNSVNADYRTTTAHNPDQCWVKYGGWKEHLMCEQASLELRARSKRLESSGSDLDFDSSSKLKVQCSISPIEYRLLESPDGSESYHVYFWQIWGGEVVPIRKVHEISIWERMKRPDYWKIWKPRRKPLYFVRIHSKTPLAPVISQSEIVDGSTMLTTGGKLKTEKSDSASSAERGEIKNLGTRGERLEPNEVSLHGVGKVRVVSLEQTADASSAEREAGDSNNLKPLTFDLKLADEADHQHYLVDYPEVRELLLAIHKLTTGEQLAN